MVRRCDRACGRRGSGTGAAGGDNLCAAGGPVVDCRGRRGRRRAAGGLNQRPASGGQPGSCPRRGSLRPVAAQRQDACEHLQALDARKIRLQAPKKRLLAAAALLVLCAGTLLIPGGGDRIVSERKILQEKTARMAEEIDEAEAAEEAGKTEKEKAELRKLTADLKRELEER